MPLLEDTSATVTTTTPAVRTGESVRRASLTDRDWLLAAIDGAWAVGLAAAWWVLFAVALALEPATDHAVPAIAVVLGTVQLALLVTAAVGLLLTRRVGVMASLGAAVVLVAGSVACPTTGHHTIGLWWFGQMAASLALVGLSAVALRRA